MLYACTPVATGLAITSRLTVFKILISQVLSSQFLGVLFNVLLGAIRVDDIVPALTFGISCEIVFICVQRLPEVLVGLTLRSKFGHVLILLLLLHRLNVSVRHVRDFSLDKCGRLPRLFFLSEFGSRFNY